MRERAEILAEITGGIRQALAAHEPERVWDAFLKGICPAMKCAAGSYFAADDERKKLTLLFVYGPHAPEIKNMMMSYEGVVGWVAEKRQAMLVNDAAKDARFFKAVDDATGFKTTHILCVPVIYAGRLLGVVELMNPAKGIFTEDDLDTVNYICAGVARVVAVQEQER
ncbi:MAG: GAF domain-containing protein [Elusimicrobiaceae bacterium]|nr:GAF domain-containing protein [Elusimicrobiaceae bacterium]